MSGYKERDLTREERYLAGTIRDVVPRAERLHICQQIAHVAENLRDQAHAANRENIPWEERKKIWDALHFPRYKFFDAALPSEGWYQFSESRTTCST